MRQYTTLLTCEPMHDRDIVSAEDEGKVPFAEDTAG